MPDQTAQGKWTQGQDGNWYYVNQSGQPLYLVSASRNGGYNLFQNPNVPSGQTQPAVNWQNLSAEQQSALSNAGVSPNPDQNGLVPVTQAQLDAVQSSGSSIDPSNISTTEVPGSPAPSPTNDIFANAPQGSPLAGQSLATGPGQQGIGVVQPQASSGGFGSALGIGGALGGLFNTAGQFAMDPGVQFMLPAIAGGVIAAGNTPAAAEGAAGGATGGTGLTSTTWNPLNPYPGYTPDPGLSLANVTPGASAAWDAGMNLPNLAPSIGASGTGLAAGTAGTAGGAFGAGALGSGISLPAAGNVAASPGSSLGTSLGGAATTSPATFGGSSGILAGGPETGGAISSAPALGAGLGVGVLGGATGGLGAAGVGALLGTGVAALGGGNQPAGTTTTVQDLPAWQQPYVLDLLNRTQAASQPQTSPLIGSGQNFLQGNISGDYLNSNPSNSSFTNLSGATNPGLNSLAPFASGQYINSNPGMSSLQQTANGAYLNSNPYLDAMFNKAAAQVAGGVNSNFEAAGRYGSGAQAGELGTQLGNLATNIYGNNYATERQNQLNAAGTLGNLYNTGVSNAIGAGTGLSGAFGTQGQIQLGGATGLGTNYNNAANRQITGALSAPSYAQGSYDFSQAPLNQFGNYATRGFGSSTTQPYFNNNTANLLGGALAGASLGNLFRSS